MVSHTNINDVLDTRESVDILLDRYKHLSIKSSLIERDTKEKETRTNDLTKDIKTELIILDNRISSLKKIVTEAELVKKAISSDFKKIAKQDSYNKLNRRVDKLKYEEFIVRDELNRLFE